MGRQTNFLRSSIVSLAVCGVASVALLAPDLVAAQTLKEALALTYDGNPTLRAARAALRSVNEGVPQELSNWRPLVTLNGSVGKQRIDSEFSVAGSQTTTPHEGSISLVQPLFRGFRTVSGVARAENQVLSQRQSLRLTEQQVLLRATTAYMDVWRDQAILNLNINNEQVLGRQLEASNDRFEVGEITRTDVAQSESRLSRATGDRIAAEGNLEISRAVFLEVIGNPAGTLQQPPSLQGLPNSEADVIAIARESNPDVLSVLYAEKAAQENVRQVFGELLPTLNLNGTVSRTRESSSSSSRNERDSIIAQLTVPLYQQGFVSSRVREAKQLASQRRLELEEAVRRVEQQSVSSWEALVTARAQIESSQAEVRSGEIALDGVRQENAVGARTVLDILDAEQELLDAQVGLVRVQRDEVVASFQVLFAMGSLNAMVLELPVEFYDVEDSYQSVRGRWFGISAPESGWDGEYVTLPDIGEPD